MTAAVTVITPLLAAGNAGGPLARACGNSDPGIACRLAWDLTHNPHVADFTTVYLAGPASLILRIAFVLLLAVLLRIAAQRLIARLTSRVALGSRRQSAGHAGSGGTPEDDEPDDDEPDDDEPEDDEPEDDEPDDELPDMEAATASPAAGTAGTAAGSRRHRVFGERRSQRATALASLLGNAASVTIFSVAAVIILGDMGLNLAPVLASAGVLGIAIGFGAQNLVKDFLAGIFMLLEDQYGVGDTVDVGTVSGTVEAVSLRITRLRDVNGVVWHIRNGTIKRAGNETHRWARAVIDFPVPYSVPVAAASDVLQNAAIGLWQEPAWQGIILEQPEIWGVQDVSADTVVIRVTARTVPQGKLAVASELRARLKSALDAAAVSQALSPRVAAGSPQPSAGLPQSSAVPQQASAVPQQADEPAGS